MKHIIMFKGGVETLEFFSVEIAKYFEKVLEKIVLTKESRQIVIFF